MRRVRQWTSVIGGELLRGFEGSRVRGFDTEPRNHRTRERRTSRIPCMAKLKSELELRCPCCNSILVVDTNLGRIVSHKEPERGDKPELSEAARILADEARRREALFEQSVEAEKTRGDALARRFEEALRQAKEEPVTKPLRDFDLD